MSEKESVVQWLSIWLDVHFIDVLALAFIVWFLWRIVDSLVKHYFPIVSFYRKLNSIVDAAHISDRKHIRMYLIGQAELQSGLFIATRNTLHEKSEEWLQNLVELIEQKHKIIEKQDEITSELLGKPTNLQMHWNLVLETSDDLAERRHQHEGWLKNKFFSKIKKP